MPRRRKNMAHNTYKYYNDGKRDIRVGGRDIRHGGRDMRDEGRDLRRGGRDLRDIGRDLRGSDIRDGRDISDGGREKGYTVQDFPPPTSEDLDFDDPPPFLGSLIEQVFWCLSARVRQVIMDKYPRRVYFCFYKGVCTWACEDNPSVAVQRIRDHHKKHPHHFISPYFGHMQPWIKEMDRRKLIRNELREKRTDYSYSSSQDSRYSQERNLSRFTKPPNTKGITYRYPDPNQEDTKEGKRSRTRSRSRSRSYDKHNNLRFGTFKRRKTDSPASSSSSPRNTSVKTVDSLTQPFISPLATPAIKQHKISKNITFTPAPNLELSKKGIKLKFKLDLDEKKRKKYSIKPQGDKATETGTCKYCSETVPLKQMKQHYLNHKSDTQVNPKDFIPRPDPISITNDQEKMLLQENCVSSSNQRTLVQTYQEENPPQYLGNSSKYFDFYNTDIDDLSQYELSDPPSSPYTSMDNHPPNYLEIASTHNFPSQIESIRNEDHKNTNVATFNTMVILKQEVFDDDMDIKQERDPLDYHQDNIFIDIDDDDDEDLEPPGEEKDYFDNNRILKETERKSSLIPDEEVNVPVESSIAVKVGEENAREERYERIMSVEEAMEALHSDGFMELSSVGDTRSVSEDALVIDDKGSEEPSIDARDKDVLIVRNKEDSSEIINYEEDAEEKTSDNEDTSKCFTLEEDSPETVNPGKHPEKHVTENIEALSTGSSDKCHNDKEITDKINVISGDETNLISEEVQNQDTKETNNKVEESKESNDDVSEVIEGNKSDVSPVQVSQILQNTDNLIEEIRENLDHSKEEIVNEVKNPPAKKKNDKLIIVMSTLESNILDAEKCSAKGPEIDECNDETTKQGDKESPKIHLVKKDGIFTIDNKKTPTIPIRENWEVLKPANRNKRKSSQEIINLNLKVDDCNMCKKCNAPFKMIPTAIVWNIGTQELQFSCSFCCTKYSLSGLPNKII